MADWNQLIAVVIIVCNLSTTGQNSIAIWRAKSQIVITTLCTHEHKSGVIWGARMTSWPNYLHYICCISLNTFAQLNENSNTLLPKLSCFWQLICLCYPFWRNFLRLIIIKGISTTVKFPIIALFWVGMVSDYLFPVILYLFGRKFVTIFLSFYFNCQLSKYKTEAKKYFKLIVERRAESFLSIVWWNSAAIRNLRPKSKRRRGVEFRWVCAQNACFCRDPTMIVRENVDII